jgi:hypothetical protein
MYEFIYIEYITIILKLILPLNLPDYYFNAIPREF